MCLTGHIVMLSRLAQHAGLYRIEIPISRYFSAPGLGRHVGAIMQLGPDGGWCKVASMVLLGRLRLPGGSRMRLPVNCRWFLLAAAPINVGQLPPAVDKNFPWQIERLVNNHFLTGLEQQKNLLVSQAGALCIANLQTLPQSRRQDARLKL
jgi:hypothetical protein